MSVVNNLKKIGFMSSTHAIKGELKLSILNNLELEDFFIDTYIFIKKNDETFIPYKVSKMFYKQNKLVVKLDEISSIDEAEKLLHKECYISEEKYYHFITEKTDYLKYEVFENNKSYGNVIEVMNNGAYDLFKVNLKTKSVWIPNVSRYIAEIDNDKKVIKIINSEVLV